MSTWAERIPAAIAKAELECAYDGTGVTPIEVALAKALLHFDVHDRECCKLEAFPALRAFVEKVERL